MIIDPTYGRYPVKYLGIESRMLVARGLREKRIKNYCSIGKEFLFEKKNNSENRCW